MQQQFPKLSVVTEQRKLGIKALAELKYSGRKIGQSGEAKAWRFLLQPQMLPDSVLSLRVAGGEGVCFCIAEKGIFN